MNYYYEENYNEIYLVCQMEGEELHTFSHLMIENNQIFGLVKPVYQCYGQGLRRLVYNVTNCMTVKDYLYNYGNQETVSYAYEYIKSIKASIASYGISERNCLWDLNSMYFDCYTGKIYVICVPVDVCVSYSLQDHILMNNLKGCLRGEVSEGLYPYLDQGEYEGETTVLCASGNPYVVGNVDKPRFKLFQEDGRSRREIRMARKEARKEERKARKLERKQDKEIRKQIAREEGFGFCQIPSLT